MERVCCRFAVFGGMINHRLNVSLRRAGAADGLATPAGFEPATTSLEGERSIQLSYGVTARRGRPRLPTQLINQSPTYRALFEPEGKVSAQLALLESERTRM